jgi:thiamine transport system substrate-binding protein
VDFLVGARFQADLPLAMFVYPVRLGVALPDAFVRHSLRPERPLAVDPRRIAEERTAWLEDFTQIVLR